MIEENDKFLVLKGPGQGFYYFWDQRTDNITEMATSSNVIITSTQDPEIIPFIVPGPGIVPSHFPKNETFLLFPKNKDRIVVWIDIPPELDLFTLHAWFNRKQTSLGGFEGERMKSINWMNPGCSYTSAEVKTMGKSGLYRLEIGKVEKDFRLSISEGFPLFLKKPYKKFPYSKLMIRVFDKRGEAIDSRVSIFRRTQRLAIQDILRGECGEFWTLPGPITIKAEHGIEYAPSTRSAILEAGGTFWFDLTLRRTLYPDEGWIWGDHHTHTFFADGGQSPEKNARAARAEGLHYMFLSDGMKAFSADFTSHNEAGYFLGLPGQELMNPYTHCNALNCTQDLPHIPFGVKAKSYPGPKEWLQELKKQRKKGVPNALQLNHPSHVPEVTSNPCSGYFRSWWVIDENREVRLVENFDFPSWFDRLNRGYKLTGLWTTDGHDNTFIPPGFNRICLYTGGKLDADSIIEALMGGHVFNTRHPGALLYLTVNGKIPGEIAKANANDKFIAKVRCQSNRPIEKIDLVQDGYVSYSLFGNDGYEMEAEVSLNIDETSKWVLALLYTKNSPYLENEHSGSPLDRSGVIAFTNPIFLEQI